MYSAFFDVDEEVADEARSQRRWEVYRASDALRTNDERSASSLKSGLATVVSSLCDARTDLDVLIDVASAIGDQQHLGVSHVPQSLTIPVSKQNVLAMSLKRAQLREIAGRLSASATILRGKYCSEQDAFAHDVAELRRRWLVSEYVGTSTQGDDCVVITVRFHVEDEWDWLNSRSLGKHTFVIARDQNAVEGDGACALFREGLVRGWQAIDAQLRSLRSERAWKLVQAALEEEAVANEATCYSDVQRAVLALSRASSSSKLPDRICREDRMLYLDSFCRSDLCRRLFRKRSMVALREAMSWQLVPDVVKRTTRTSLASFTEQLCNWVSFSAMWFEVAGSLAENDPWKRSLHEYLTALSRSPLCVPAKVRCGSTLITIDKAYTMTTPTCRIGRLQLRELIDVARREGRTVDMEF